MEEKAKKPVPPEVKELVEQMGEFMKTWGLKKIHGKIWSSLFLSETPLDAAELMNRLDISKSLVSMTLSDLNEIELVEMTGKSDRGTQLYKANSDLSVVVVNILRYRERKVLAQLNTSFNLVNTLPDDEKKKYKLDNDKIQKVGDFINQAETFLVNLLKPKAS